MRPRVGPSLARFGETLRQETWDDMAARFAGFLDKSIEGEILECPPSSDRLESAEPKASPGRSPMPKWGWLEWFVVAQTALPALMFILACRWSARRRGSRRSRSPWWPGGRSGREGVRTWPGREVPGHPLAGPGHRLADGDDPPSGRQHDACPGSATWHSTRRSSARRSGLAQP